MVTLPFVELVGKERGVHLLADDLLDEGIVPQDLSGLEEIARQALGA